MRITELKILSDGDVVDKVEDNKVYVRGQDSSYYIYSFNLDEADNIIDYDVMIVKKGSGIIKLNLDADLNDLKDAKKD